MEDLTAKDVLFYLTGKASPEVARKCDDLRGDPNSIVSRLIDRLRRDRDVDLRIDWGALAEAASDADHEGDSDVGETEA